MIVTGSYNRDNGITVRLHHGNYGHLSIFIEIQRHDGDGTKRCHTFMDASQAQEMIEQLQRDIDVMKENNHE